MLYIYIQIIKQYLVIHYTNNTPHSPKTYIQTHPITTKHTASQ